METRDPTIPHMRCDAEPLPADHTALKLGYLGPWLIETIECIIASTNVRDFYSASWEGAVVSIIWTFALLTLRACL